MQGTATKLKASDLRFLLNYRVVPFKSDETVGSLKDLVLNDRAISDEEYKLILRHKEPSSEDVEKFRAIGWFNKTFETVRAIASGYAKKHPVLINGEKRVLVYTPLFTTEAVTTKITKLLLFYEMKGLPIPIHDISLSNEQKLVVERKKGVTVVNSGPGTGKTEMAAHKAAKLVDEGVLVVSFTNAAVNNFMSRLQNIISNVRGISKKREQTTRIWLTTIDSITHQITPRGQRGVDFALIVDTAIREHEQFANIFLEIDGRPKFKHLIVDEGQDVSDAHYQFLFKAYERWNFESMTIIGDPRQRLDIKCGGVFQDLLMRGTNDTECGTLDCPFVVNSTGSFRFENPLLLKLCNTLSSTRPGIHAELTYSGEPSEETPLTKFSSPDQIAGDIISKRDAGVKLHDIAIISPVTKKSSRTKTQLDQVCQILSFNEIMTCDEPRDDTIYKSSIQSVKGLEFDHVYFIGASGYPSYMNQEYQDINDGMSMNFVVNTRARKSITYLTDDSLRAPDTVPESMTVGGQAKEVSVRKEVYQKAIKTSDISASDYKTFFETNMMAFHMEEKDSFLTQQSDFMISDAQYEIISAIISHMDGTCPLNKQVNEITAAGFAECNRLGDIHDLIRVDNKVCIRRADIPLASEIMEGYDMTDIEMHRKYKKLMTGRNSTLPSMDRINDVIVKIGSLLNEDDNPEHVVFHNKLLASGITDKSTCIVFTECNYLGALLKKRLPNKAVYMVKLESGVIVEVHDPGYTEKQIEYMVNSLFSITVHIKLIRSRGRYSLVGIDKRKPWYFIDTEFTSRVYNKCGTIYDVALINGYEPYASMCSLILCDKDDFNPFNGNVEYKDLIGAPTPRQFYTAFRTIIQGKEPIIWYYSTTVDVSIFYEFDKLYTQAWKEKADMQKKLKSCSSVQEREQLKAKLKADWAYVRGYDYGFTFRNARPSSGKGTMKEVYEQVTMSNVDSYKHTILHTAVSDTLLLMEYVMTRELCGMHEEPAVEVDE